MSHFTVLVVGEDAEEQLAPFNEADDKFCIFTDEETEYLKEYTTKTMEAVRLKDGTLLSKYDESLKHNWIRAGLGISSDDRFTPPVGAKVITVGYSEVYKTFEIFMKSWHGMDRNEKHNRYGSTRNPNAKWDWYELGGRWTGFFKLKNRTNSGNQIDASKIRALADQYGTTESIVNGLVAALQLGDYDVLREYDMKHPIRGGYALERTLQSLLTVQYPNAEVGRPGLGAKLPPIGMVDSARIKDIDFEGMVRDAGIEARERFEKVEGLLGGSIPKMTIQWKDVIDENNEKYNKLSIEEKRTLYHAQPAKKAVEAAKKVGLSKEDSSLLTWLELDQYQCTKEEFVKHAENRALSTFAVLKDGQWHEKGKMGWWCCVGDEKDEDQWNAEFFKLLKSLPEDTLISVYDCHT